jgi:hypothetical protein
MYRSGSASFVMQLSHFREYGGLLNCNNYNCRVKQRSGQLSEYRALLEVGFQERTSRQTLAEW